MEELKPIQIISFYEFKDLLPVGELGNLKVRLREALAEFGVRGTIIISAEGYNGMVCGEPDQIFAFIPRVERILQTTLTNKSSFHGSAPFRKIDVKIKPEIVTLKQEVDISLGRGTHVKPDQWNEVISDPETYLLDARNDYEHRSGTFRGAVNPSIAKFSELPAFVAKTLEPASYKRVAMFCTGGIRCEKFAPYLKQLGFADVVQLEGGILNYLEEVSPDETLWEGECFVFDERISVDASLQKGTGVDQSQRHVNAKKPRYKVAK